MASTIWKTAFGAEKEKADESLVGLFTNRICLFGKDLYFVAVYGIIFALKHTPMPVLGA